MQLECSDMSYVEYMKVLWYAIVEGIVECGKTFIYSTYDISERSNCIFVLAEPSREEQGVTRYGSSKI